MTGASGAPGTPPRLFTLVAATGLAALSMNVFLPSLPGMAVYFGVDYAVMQLTVTGYLAANAVLQLLVGPLSDRFGRRPVMLTGLCIFVLATLASLLAPTAGWFLFFRMMQATVVSAFVLSRAIIRDMVDGERAASRIAYVTMGMSLVPMAAPAVGGVLDEAFGWKANFSMQAILGAAVVALVWFDLGETARSRGIPLGQQVRGYPVLARSVRFWGYCAAAAFASGAFFAYLGGAPFVGQTVYHLSPAEVGYFFAAPAVGYLVGNFISARWSVLIGMNRMILYGALVAALALGGALLADLAGGAGPLVFFGAIGLMGIGNGMVLPNANVGMMSVRPELAGTASGLGGALMTVGGAILSALAGVMLTPERGATPLLTIMTVSGIASLLAILWVLARETQLLLRSG